jgi:hypothetical protein
MRWTDTQITAVRDGMTPGQRQTAALAVILAIIILWYGAPHPTGTTVPAPPAQVTTVPPAATP